MNGQTLRLRSGAAVRALVAGLFFIAGTPFAAAQDNPAPASDTPAPVDGVPAPADTTSPDANPANSDSAAAPADAAPAEAAAPAPETVTTIPVDAGKAEATPRNATQLDTVQVTGSRLRRTDYETAAPVVTLTREDIERTGLTDINDILRHMSVAGNNGSVPAVGRGYLTLGETNLDLRNLGAQHTLLLVNGRRWVTGLSSTQPNVSDYNTIPTSIIERVEVLKDGASAIYGSDAIAGVVNIITRKDYQGLGLSYHAGSYIQQGDGLNQQAVLDYGVVQPGQSFFMSASWTGQDRAATSNRSFTASPIPTAGKSRWSNNTTRGRFVFVGNNANATQYMCPNLQAGIAASTAADPNISPVLQQTKPVPAGLALCDLARIPGATGTAGTGNTQPTDYRYKLPDEDVYNRYQTDSLENPNQRTALFTQISQDLTDHINFSVEGLYNKRVSNTLSANIAFLGGDGLGAAFARAGTTRDNPINPFGQDVGISAAGLPAEGYGFWTQRLVGEQGQLQFKESVDTGRLGGTLKGDFQLLDTAFNWDGGYIWSKSKIEEIVPLENFDIVQREMGNVVDPNSGAVTYDPTTCQAPCILLDPYHGQEHFDYKAVAAAFTKTYQRNEGAKNNAFLDLSFELPNYGNVLVAPIAVAIGAEYRKDSYSSQIDPILKQGGIVLLNQQQDSGGTSYAREAYLELGVPVLKDLPFAQRVDLDLAGRFSAYPGFGSITTGKAGLLWQPLDDLLVRGSYSTGFRAPSIAELNLPPTQSGDPLSDPCANPQKDATTQSNCNAGGAGGATGQVNSPYDLWQGNPNLSPETSINITYGLVFSPHWVPDLNFNVDFFKIKLENFVTIGLGQYFLDSCYKQAKQNYCQYIHRDETGELTFIDTPFFNLGKIETSGVDFGTDYILPVPEQFGRFKASLDASYMSKFNQYTPQPGAADVVVGLVGQDSGQFSGFPRWKAGTSLVWKNELWNASWDTRMAYHMVEPCGDVYGNANPAVSYRNLGLCSDPKLDAAGNDVSTNKLKTVFYHNITLGRSLPGYNADITIGINNVLDQNPPISYSNTGSGGWFNYDPQAYEIPGRVGYLQANFKF